MRKIIIDTDPGVDDAFAIITAMIYKDFDILGITAVGGNKHLDFVTKNALKLVHLMNYDCKVYKGAHAALKDMHKSQDEIVDAGETHGIDGLSGVELEYDLSKLDDKPAVDFILETVKKNPDEIEIIALGPLTNIAMAIQKDPETMKRVKVIWSMGGGVNRGNTTPVSEFNYWFDAESVKITYDFGQYIDIYMFGLDVTYKTFFSANDFFFLKHECGELGRYLYEMGQAYTKAYWKNRHITGAVIHDLVPVIFAIDSSISDKEDVHHCALEVSCNEGWTYGQTIVDLDNHYSPKKNAYVVMNADARKFKEIFLEIVFGQTVEVYKKYVKS